MTKSKSKSKVNAKSPRFINQNHIDDVFPPIKVTELLESALVEETLRDFLETSTLPRPIKIGIAGAYSTATSTTGRLIALALATMRSVLIIQFHDNNKKYTVVRELFQTQVLCNSDCLVHAFDLGPLALSLFLDHRLRMSNGVDIQQACFGAEPTERRTPLEAVEFAVGDRTPIYKENITSAFRDDQWDPARTTTLALRAWLSTYIAGLPDMEERFNGVKKVNTQERDESYLEMVAGIARADQLMASKRASSVANEFRTPTTDQEKAKIPATRFQSKFRKNTNVKLSVRDDVGDVYEVHGRTVDVQGRTATFQATDISLEGKTIISAVTIDADGPTMADKLKSCAILQALQSEGDLLKSPFLSYIMSPKDDFTWPEIFTTSDTTPSVISPKPLNVSQLEAVEHMLSLTNDTRVTMVWGPPGTGKTTAIAAYVCSAVAGGLHGIWLIAQTNVAVKNIAEKLADVGFLDFKLLVSIDFHMEWHEHIYYKINKNVIRSEQFKRAQNELEGCSVILCTLSMLSNPFITRFTSKIPIVSLVVDEASQIAVNDYIPPLQKFESIRKICFIGDDRQLPPYGQDEVEYLVSVFEKSHLRDKALMLNTQYRMPPYIGDFISDEMYDGQLASNPEHPVKDASAWFVHVEGSYEKKHGTSWINQVECEAVIKIATKLQEDNKNYRIITPYDAQRSLLENTMKTYGLRWQDKCFNVDSFQGNEDDYIIISLVRSKDLGFLKDRRRTNVMLTRCKHGMYICTTWEFIWEVAQETLVGKMAAAWRQQIEEVWKGQDHLKSGDF